MKLELEVLASTSIKRKKPWPRLAFIGEVYESMFMLDAQRISVLYIPSGKTKRKVHKVSNLLPQVIKLTYSDNGHFIGGLLDSGKVFLWHKETDTLRTTEPLEAVKRAVETQREITREQQLQQGGSGKEKKKKKQSDVELPDLFMCISGSGKQVLVSPSPDQLYIWQLADGDSLFWRSKDPRVHGAWTQVVPDQSLWPWRCSPETAQTARFYIDQGARGMCCNYSLVYNDNYDVRFTTLTMRWLPDSAIYTYSEPIFVTSTQSFSRPLSTLSAPESIFPPLVPVGYRGAYVAATSHDGRLLAVAVNQHNSYLNRVVFVAPGARETLLVADLRGCGSRNQVIRYSRSYWVCDIQWTSDDLFVACMLEQGSVCMITRLGEPLLLSTYGCSIEMGPKLFLPLHPLILVKGGAEETPEDQHAPEPHPSPEALDPMRQRFSLTTHPRYPLIVCSDGYMVTVLQLPGDTSCLSVMKGLVLESNRYLKRIKETQKTQLTLFDSIKKQNTKANKYAQSNERMGLAAGKSILKQSRYGPPTVGYRFEEPPTDLDEEESADRLNETLDSDLPEDPLLKHMAAGKISFGDTDNMNTTLDYRTLAREEGLSVGQNIDRAQRCLVLAWSLGASHVGVWTSDHETVSLNIIYNMVKLFSALLHSSQGVTKELTSASGTNTATAAAGPSPKSNKKLVKVLKLVRRMLDMLRLDNICKHMQVVALRLAQDTTQLLLTNRDLGMCESKKVTFHGAIVLLKYVESYLGSIYIDLPLPPFRGKRINGLQMFGHDLYEPSGLVKLVNNNNVGDAVIDRKEEREEEEGKSERTNVVSEEEGYVSRERDDAESREDLEERSQTRISTSSGDTGAHRKSQVVGCELKSYTRLAPVWCYLYKQLVAYFNHLTRSIKGQRGQERAATRSESWKILELVVAVECKLQTLCVPIPLRTKTKIYPGERQSLDGSGSLAIQSWVQNLDLLNAERVSGRRGSRILLAILYTLLQQGQLRAALDLTEFLIRSGNVHKGAALCRRDRQTRISLLSLLLEVPSSPGPPERIPPVQYIRCQAIRVAVQSMARFMAAYFTNRAMFVYPAHCPKKLPPMHVQYTIAGRVLPISRSSVSTAVRVEGLDNLWTVERAMEYLMLCGATSEAAWLAHTLGDWKTAILIGVAVNKHQRMLPQLYEQKKKLCLPPEIEPHQILYNKLEEIFLPSDYSASPAPDTLERPLSDVLLASVLGRLSVLPWLLHSLTERLRHLVHQFSALVPEGFYLPAPPVYCPQPAVQREEREQDVRLQDVDAVRQERMLRHQLSSVLQFILVALRASHTTLPAARCYVQHVVTAFAKGLKYQRHLENDSVEVDIAVLQEAYLSVQSLFLGQEQRSTVHAVLEGFREMCTVTWMMYARDKMALALREKAHRALYRQQKGGSLSAGAWQSDCEEALDWTLHMLPFSRCLQGGDTELPGALIALVLELPATEECAHYLAEYLHDTENLHPDVQEKLDAVLKLWRGVFLKEEPPLRRQSKHSPRSGSENSPRGLTLSLYYEKISQRMAKTLRRKNKTFKKFEQYVTFDDDKEEERRKREMFVGSRPMESQESYLKFLDIFFAVCFSKVVDQEKENGASPLKPLLQDFGSEIVDKELTSLAHQSITSFQKKDSMNRLNFNHSPIFPPGSPRSPSPRSKAYRPYSDRVRSTPPMSPQSRVGLFRSRSLSELRESPKVQHDRGRRPTLLDMSLAGEEEGDEGTGKPPSPRRRSRSRSSDKNFTRSEVRRSRSGDRSMRMEDLDGGGSAKRYVLDRSASINDIDRSPIRRSTSEEMGFTDPLNVPILQNWIVDKMDFGKAYVSLEQLLEWMGRWAGRNHMLGDSNISRDSERGKPTMRIRVPPRIIIYSLWQREQIYADFVVHKEHALDSYDVDVPGNDQDTQTDVTITGLDEEEEASLAISVTGLPHDDVETEMSRKSRRRRSSKRKKKKKQRSPRPVEKQEIVPDMIEATMEPMAFAAEKEDTITEAENLETTQANVDRWDEENRASTSQQNELRLELEALDKTDDELTPRFAEKTEAKKTKKARKLSFSDAAENTLDELDLSNLIEQEMKHSMRDTLAKLRSSMNLESNMRVEDLIDTPDQRQHDQAPSVKSDASLNTTMPFTDREPLSAREGPSRGGRGVSARDASTPRSPERRAGDNPVAEELRDIVRGELRKIMQAQHQGILAMLGAIDGEPVNPGTNTAVASQGRGSSSGRPHHTKSDRIEPVECLVMNVTQQQQHQPPQQQQHHHHHHHHQDPSASFTHVTSFTEKSSTDVEVTPLPSDIEDSEKSGHGKPLSVSQLTKAGERHGSTSVTWSKGQVPLGGALQELHSLSSQQIPNSKAKSGKDNKENIPVHMPPLLHTPSSHPAHPSQQYQPFGRLMGVLSQINQNLGGGSSTSSHRMPPAERDISQPGYFHPPRHPPQQSSAVPRMPLIQPESGFVNSQVFGGMHQFQVPERDTSPLLPSAAAAAAHPPQGGAPSGSSIPFPLLSLRQDPQAYHQHQGQHSQVPRLIPPEELIAHEQNKYQKKKVTAKQVKALLDQYKSEEEKARQMAMGARLLRADFEPFAEKDERDKQARQKRREKRKTEKKSRRKHKKGEKDTDTESLITEPVSEETDEVSAEVRAEQAVLSSAPKTPRSSRKSSPRKTPRHIQGAEEVEEGDIQQAGYALTPGLFNDYLNKDGEYGTALDNNARLQLKAATGIKSSSSSPRKRDQAFQTEEDRTTDEAANAVVRQALEKYYSSRGGQPGAVLAPDIFLGLRFADSAGQQGAQVTDEPGGGRSFLNVVDLNGDLIDQITAAVPEKDRSGSPTRRGRSPVRRADSRLVSSSPQRRVSPGASPQRGSPTRDQRQTGPDRVTTDMFEDTLPPGFGGEHISRAGRLKTKDSIRKRLATMDQQFDAISAMAQNIDDDFKSTKVMLHTMENINEAIHPRRHQHDATVLMSPEEKKAHREAAAEALREQQEDDLYDQEEEGEESPRHVSVRRSEELEDKLQLSGLSGVSDIVGEYIRSGDIVPEELGLTENEGQELADIARVESRDGSPRQKALSASSLRRQNQKTEEEREKLQQWMAEKQRERLREYKNKREQLREAERAPFKPTAELMRTGPIEDLQKTRVVKSKSRQEENMELRKQQASELLRDILQDKPELPPESPRRERSVSRERSPRGTQRGTARKPSARTAQKSMRTRTPSPQGSRSQRYMSPASRREAADMDRIAMNAEEYMYDDGQQQQQQPQKFASRTSVVPTRSDFSPARPLSAQQRQQQQQQQQQQQSEERVAARKQKKLEDMVRLQRPEATRSRTRLPKKPVPYVDRLAQVSSTGNTGRSTGSTQRSQQRLYGSTHLPGQSRQRRGPRTVKTYAERLQEMKPPQNATFTRPAPGPTRHGARQHTGRSSELRTSVERRGLPPPRPRRSLTYQEQLQALQPPKELYRSRDSDSEPLQQTVIRRPLGPAHKPKTYTEQLQELQRPHSGRHKDAYGPVDPKVYRTQPLRSMVRQRPYADPYSGADDTEPLSVVSPWSMDDNVHNILYDGEDTSYAPASAAATDFDISQMSDLDYLEGDAYTSRVGVQELDAVSLSDGSVLSFIDWDQVENILQEN